jgi:hypothetical protein
LNDTLAKANDEFTGKSKNSRTPSHLAAITVSKAASFGAAATDDTGMDMERKECHPLRLMCRKLAGLSEA